MRLVALLQCTLLLLIGAEEGQAGAANLCPVVYLKDGCTPQESRSVCWSPGKFKLINKQMSIWKKCKMLSNIEKEFLPSIVIFFNELFFNLETSFKHS